METKDLIVVCKPSASSSCGSSELSRDMILVEIFPRLPVKSLIRFKCVSRTFKTLISSTELSQIYLHRSLSPDGKRLLILPEDDRIVIYDLDAPFSPAISSFTWSRYNGPSLVGSYHGLLCLCLYYGVAGVSNPLFLLNPSTRLFLDIHFPYPSRVLHNFGFGYDPATTDYKIVAIRTVDSNNTGVITRVARIYSLITKSWKEIESTGFEGSMRATFAGVLLNDHLLHWMFWCPSISKIKIGCFDVCSEEWRDDVLLPAHYYDPDLQNYTFLDFGILDGCLFSVFENRAVSVSTADVWVMKQYREQDSWFKLLSIPISEDLRGGVVPLTFRRGSSQVLLRHRANPRLFWFNTENNDISDAEIQVPPHFTLHQAYLCSETLVSLPGGKLFEDANQRSIVKKT